MFHILKKQIDRESAAKYSSDYCSKLNTIELHKIDLISQVVNLAGDPSTF